LINPVNRPAFTGSNQRDFQDRILHGELIPVVLLNLAKHSISEAPGIVTRSSLNDVTVLTLQAF